MIIIIGVKNAAGDPVLRLILIVVPVSGLDWILLSFFWARWWGLAAWGRARTKIRLLLTIISLTDGSLRRQILLIRGTHLTIAPCPHLKPRVPSDSSEESWISSWHDHISWWRNNLVVGSPGPRQASRQHCHARGRVIESIHVIFMLFIHFILFMFLWPVGGEPGPGCQMLKFRVKGQLGSDLCIIIQFSPLSFLPTPARPIKCPFISQNSSSHTMLPYLLLSRLIPYLQTIKRACDTLAFSVFQMSHIVCQVWTLLNNERFSKVALFIVNQLATFCCKPCLFNKNFVST